MSFYISNSLIQTYRLRSKSKKIESLNGRNGNTALTKFVMNRIVEEIPIKEGMIIIDVGCGDASFFRALLKKKPMSKTFKLIGVLPTEEEVTRVKEYVAKNFYRLSNCPSIIISRADKLDVPDQYCDLLVCNSVLHGNGQTLGDFKVALIEFNRVLKPGGKLFIGELPNVDEMKGKNYGNSLFKWLMYLKKERGFKALLKGVLNIINSAISSEPFVFVPKNMFYIGNKDLYKVMKDHGFTMIFMKKHLEIGPQGEEILSMTRWNYLARKDEDLLNINANREKSLY